MDEQKLTGKYDFDKDMLKIIIESIPGNVFFKDTECRYQMVSHVCDELNCGGNNGILGKTDFEVQNDPDLAQFYYDDDKKIIATRTGSHYISEMVFGGISFYYEITKQPVMDAQGNVCGVIGLVTDVTEFRRLQDKLKGISNTDLLTGVYNRNYFEQRIAEVSQTDYSGAAVIMSDTNGLKYLNDHFGHAAGDELLKESTSIMKEVLGDSGEIMRIGGDEFIALCFHCTEDMCKEFIAQIKTKEKTRTIFRFPISNAYGYAAITSLDQSLYAAISDAEKMMYQDKVNFKEDYLVTLIEMAQKDSCKTSV